MVTPRQGEIWWAETEHARRPVLVITRDAAIGVLTTIVVAPVTRTIRSIPTEVRLDGANGLPTECVASFDNLVPVRRTLLTERAGRLTPAQAGELCRALAALSDC